MLFRKLIRTIGAYRAQFISMIVMIALGVGVFMGFNMEWYSLGKSGNAFFDQTHYADYRVYSEAGFSEEDIEAIRSIDGVDDAVRFLSVNTTVKGAEKSLALCVMEGTGISDFLITEQLANAEYTAGADGLWLSDRYAGANGIALGDRLTVVYQGIEITGKVVGLIKSPEFAVCLADETQIMPDYTTYGYFYISPHMLEKQLGFSFYPQIHVRSALSKDEVEKAVNNALGQTTLVLSKDETVSYAAIQSEMEEGQTMGSILPVLFLLIAVLTMVTTMHRITANEKVQIGTLKALGFRDRRVLRHYTAFGLLIGVSGTVLGIGIGFGIAAYILNENSAMGQYIDLPSWELGMPWFSGLVLAALIAFLTLIGFLSVKKMLKGTAADALRPYVPKKMKKTLLEKTQLWDRMPFGTKWNLRDISRHKARSLMTLFGVVGCMVLLVGGFAMRDSMDVFTDTYYDKVCHYNTRINFTETAPNAEIEKIAEQYDGDWVASASVQMNGKTVSFEVYNIKNDNYRLIDENNEILTLSDHGAYFCHRLEDTAAVGDQVQFSPYGSDTAYEVEVVGYIRSVLTENIAVSKAYADEMGIPYHITAVFTDVDLDEVANSEWIASKTTKQALVDSLDSFMQLMYVSIIVLAVFAVILSLVVLYNLGVMSYVERYRELATLKVVGFRDKHIGRILISQNIWLTVIGILIGLPAGAGVLHYLIEALAAEYEMQAVVGPVTCGVSIVLTLGVSLLVGFFVSRKNRKIDMVEALKGTE